MAKKAAFKKTIAIAASLKRRTREHVIASLSANSIERFFLGKTHTAIKTEQDYGVDLVVFTYNSEGYVEPGNIYIQLKAAATLALSANRGFYSFSIPIKDYNAWVAEPMPVFLVLYDSSNEKGYWQYVQSYFESHPARRPRKGAGSVTVRFPVGNEFDAATVDFVRLKKQSVLDQLGGRIHHDL